MPPSRNSRGASRGKRTCSRYPQKNSIFFRDLRRQGLCRIFNNKEVVFARDLLNDIIVSGQTKEIDWNDAARDEFIRGAAPYLTGAAVRALSAGDAIACSSFSGSIL
jgi:mitochondrial fission protein ELM1